MINIMRWVEITMTTIMPQKNKEFDESVFLEKCVESFSEIRKKYQLDEETLKSAKSNPILEKMAERNSRLCCTELWKPAGQKWYVPSEQKTGS
jgi:hypothetical protein